jgi:hypothetical protein
MKWNLIDRIRRRPYLDTSRGKDGESGMRPFLFAKLLQ